MVVVNWFSLFGAWLATSWWESLNALSQADTYRKEAGDQEWGGAEFSEQERVEIAILTAHFLM